MKIDDVSENERSELERQILMARTVREMLERAIEEIKHAERAMDVEYKSYMHPWQIIRSRVVATSPLVNAALSVLNHI